MLYKLLNDSIENPDKFNFRMIMNSDSTATLQFFRILKTENSLKFRSVN
jgi:hypothetical protein